MKNIIKIIQKTLVIATMFASILGNASETSTITFKEDIKKTALTINNVKKGNLLSIKDNHGIVLYKELIQTTGTYNRGFDLTVLPDGDYFFEVDKDFEISTIPFTVKSDKVSFNKDKEVTTFKPFTRVKNGVILITKLAPNQETLDIKIYEEFNSEFDLLHSEKVEGLQIIEKAYKLRKGNYKIVLTSDNKEFTKFINN